MTIKEALSKFDTIEKKGFYMHNVEGALSSVEECEKNNPEYEYEMLAFDLQPQHANNPWGNFYYGPRVTLSDENGNPFYVPSFAQITPNAVLYWEQRYKETSNPLLTMRYASLVWDFKRSIVKTNFDNDLYRVLVDSLLAVCNEDYESHPTITVNDLEYLFELTKNQQEDLIKCKNAYCSFEKRHDDDKAVRYWSSRFLMMLKYKKCFSEEEKQDIVREHESRLTRLNTPDENGRVDPWIIEKQVQLLADYYNTLQKKEEIKRVLSVVEKAFVQEKKHMSGLQFTGNLEMIQRLYSHYQLHDEAKRLLFDVQKATGESIKEMNPQKVEFDIPKGVFEQADLMFGEKCSSDEERWNNFIIYFIPNKTQEEANLKKLAKKHPFNFMMTTKLMDAKGRPTSTIGPIDEDFDSNLAYHIAENMKISFHFLEMAIKRLIQTNAITTAKIMDNFIIPCPLFEKERYNIIRESLDLFFNGKYVLFCHLIVPQIENAICNLVELSGLSALKQQKNNKGFQLKTLDDLLREQPVVDAFTEDGSYYLRIVLTNQLGLNIRNLLCHGLLPAEHFGYGAAGRLLHILLMIGKVRLVEVK